MVRYLIGSNMPLEISFCYKNGNIKSFFYKIAQTRSLKVIVFAMFSLPPLPVLEFKERVNGKRKLDIQVLNTYFLKVKFYEKWLV